MNPLHVPVQELVDASLDEDAVRVVGGGGREAVTRDDMCMELAHVASPWTVVGVLYDECDQQHVPLPRVKEAHHPPPPKKKH